ncbi:sensor domain-containing protein [Propionivibrio dicarboxylicus]|uniref:PAS domain S-box-containing protein/diguanylate cyclase (GGDEF) domain-containing protein n=1 Tax=Propionivibrio dicarboxylicus TaxID=83767 RepID=A0A1G8DD24_9RHOO|nr:sensor domain-containing diguanylate cyclase [Propionivibrio dicarboxylicus]SDH55585.1 PAS domain S-box-containing protein/diguanylate cyclase (GGDEF) domain-containing protein [Propionivibrio dicarboxylicus]
MRSDSRKQKIRVSGGALRVVLIYAVFSSLWILFSDAAVGFMFEDRELMTLVSTLKGWLFVAVTALLLYVLVRGLINEAMGYAELEQAARREKERTAGLLEAIVDSSSDAIFAKDRDGRYLMISREVCRLVRKEAEQIVGRDDTFIFPAEQAEIVRKNDLVAMNGGHVATYEENMTTADGDRIFLATKGPLRDSDGQIIGVFGISRDITERKQAEEALRRSEENFRLFFEKNSSVMLLINPVTGEIIDANGEAVRYYGYARDQLLKMAIGDINILSPEQVALERRRAIKGERTVFLFQHRLASGEIRDVESYVTPIETSRMPLLLSIVHDITDRRRVEKALSESEERLRLALSASNQGWFDIDLKIGKIDVSADYVRLIGYDPDVFDSTLKSWTALVHPEDRAAFTAALEQCALDGVPHTIEYRCRTVTGEWIWIRSVGKTVEWDEARRAARIIGIHTDISEWKRMEEHVRQLAFYDALTGLPNRRLLHDRLIQAMLASKRSGRYCALMFIDLDNFKPLNDTHGHDAGDLLLVEVAARMRRCIREMDTVARFGGDEFVVMICELDPNDPEQVRAQALAVAEKIRLSLSQPYRISLRRDEGDPLSVVHHCSASIGVTLFVNHEIDAGEILKRADGAMYQAKEAGRNTIRFWS